MDTPNPQKLWQLEMFPEFEENAEAMTQELREAVATKRPFRVLGMGDGEVAEMSPGKFVVAVKPSHLMLYGLTRLRLNPNGTLQPMVNVLPEEMPAAEFATYLPIKYNSLMRLIVAGFVDGYKMLPGRWIVRVASYFKLQREIRKEKADGRDWWTQERLLEYQSASVEHNWR